MTEQTFLRNRRQYRRYRAPVYCKPLEFSTNYLSIVDIGLGGLRIHVAQEIKEEDLLKIDLLLPDRTIIPCSAKVAWRRPLPQWAQNKYDLGFQFLDLSAEERLQLANILQISLLVMKLEEENDELVAANCEVKRPLKHRFSILKDQHARH